MRIGRFSPKDKPSRALTSMCEVSRWGSIYGDSDKEVEINDKVDVDYTGWLQDGCIFDSTYPRGSSAKFRIGVGQVIKGWDDGLIGMKEGEVRRLNIGYEFAYGEEGIPGVIPEKSTLIFEIKLNKIIRLVNNE